MLQFEDEYLKIIYKKIRRKKIKENFQLVCCHFQGNNFNSCFFFHLLDLKKKSKIKYKAIIMILTDKYHMIKIGKDFSDRQIKCQNKFKYLHLLYYTAN